MGYQATVVLDSVGLASSTYYHKISETACNQGLSKKPPGRKIPGYSVNSKGEKVPDETIKDLIKVIIAGDGFPYGYKKINITLQEDYQLIINHKKTYRLCKNITSCDLNERYIRFGLEN